MANGNQPGEFFSNIAGGIEAAQSLEKNRAGLQGAAVDLERKRQEVEKNKLQLKNAKFQQFLTNTQNVLSAKKGPLRKIHKENARRWVQEIGFPVSDDYWELLEDDSTRIEMNKAIANLMGVEDEDKFSAAADNITPFLQNPAELITNAAKFNAEMDKHKASQAAQNKSSDLQERKFAQERIDNIVKPFTEGKQFNEFQGIKSSFARINAAASGVQIGPDGKQSKIKGIDPSIRSELKSGGIDPDKIASSGFSDIALIFNFMKMIDPGSVIREGEFRTAKQSAIPFMEILNPHLESIKRGGVLSPKQRARLVNAAKGQFIAAQTAFNQSTDELFRSAMGNFVDPKRVSQIIGRPIPERIAKVETKIQSLIARGIPEDTARRVIFERMNSLLVDTSDQKLAETKVKDGAAK